MDYLMTKTSKTFCILPWALLYIDNLGDVLPCCLSPDRNSNPEGIYFNAIDPNNIRKAWNSDKFRTLRKEFLAGKEPDNCKTCFDHERCGMESYRMGQNVQYKHLINKAIDNTMEDGSVDLNFQSLDLKLGNTCNLKCTMCGPHSSILILNDLVKNNPDYVNHPDYKLYKNLSWHKNPRFWDILAQEAPLIERIHMTGGEPLLVKEIFEFQENLIKTGKAKNITLSFNTNCTVLPSKVYKLWPQFKSIELNLSIDGIGELNDYIRHPIKWDIISKHLKQLDDDYLKLNLSMIRIHTTVQIYNIFRIGNILEYFSKNFKHIQPIPDFFPLIGPVEFNIKTLPKDIKLKAKEKLKYILENYENEFPNQYQEVYDKITGISMTIDEDIFDNSHCEQLRYRTKDFNQRNKINIHEIVPELSFII